jgi:hypothetical protein
LRNLLSIKVILLIYTKENGIFLNFMDGFLLKYQKIKSIKSERMLILDKANNLRISIIRKSLLIARINKLFVDYVL